MTERASLFPFTFRGLAPHFVTPNVKERLMDAKCLCKGVHVCGDPPKFAEGMTRLTHPLGEEKLLGGNRVLTQKIAQLRESAQRQWESLHHYVETRTEQEPCGFCGSWGEHDNDSCDLVAAVTALEEDFGCGEHWRGETIPTDDEPEGGWARNADGSFMTPEQSDEGWAVQ